MIKLVRKKLDVYYNTDTPHEKKVIERGLRIFVDGAKYSPLYRQNKWDGYFKLYESRHSRFKYGMLNFITGLLDAHNLEYKVINKFSKIIIDPDDISVKLYQHQRESLIKFFEHPYGFLKVPTRGGKTFTSAEAIRLLDKEVVLFFVDNQVLLEQAIKDISEFLKINKNSIGKIHEDIFDIKPITIAMVQTVQSIYYGVNKFNKSDKRKEKKSEEEIALIKKQYRFRKRLLLNYFSTVEFLIVDEAHEYSSDQRFNILSKIENADAYLFMSATPEKSESQLVNMKLKRISGEVFYTVDQKILKERGILAQEQVILIDINHETNYNINLTENSTYSEYEQQVIIRNERRNNIIINITEILRKIGLKTMVLFNKIEHGENIRNITNDEFFDNTVNVKSRIEGIKIFVRKKGGILLATNIFNKGITIPNLQVTFIAGGGLEQATIIQKKGRNLGVTEDKKKALQIDFIDNSKYFSEHSLSRIQVYKEAVGIENIFIYDCASDTFYQDIREFLSVFKRG